MVIKSTVSRMNPGVWFYFVAPHLGFRSQGSGLFCNDLRSNALPIVAPSKLETHNCLS